ncbi:hypothetical protein OG323_15760 [Streptomyces cyaneofuscatus]|uniref:hypothetical protein n=1 Tax=Streptomyces cyaneofuscatus TaxID=66883 RepID=UPI0038697C5B|nr:hypothetical protein OG323_15760 [Streptomyces cyaneofuscatus]
MTDGTQPGGTQPGGTTHDNASAAEGVAPRPPWLKRLVRSRVARAVTAAGLVGVLLGAGTVAWRTETLPLLSPAPCWDTFDSELTERVFGDRETVAETQRLRPDPNSRTAVYGQCRITSYKDEAQERAAKQLTAQVRRPAGYGRQDVWPAEFLAADMVPLGSGLPGMVSPVRAWLALPESCTGRAGILSAPAVVDLATGDLAGTGLIPENDLKNRAALAAAVVAVTNGVLRELGCSGTYPAPVPDKLPALVGWQDAKPGAFCGVKGLSVPAAYSDSLGRVRVGPDGGATRTCEAGGRYAPGDLRLTTVVDPTLAQVFADEAGYGGTRLDRTKGGPEGFGSVDVTRGVYLAQCQTGEVAFVIERMKAVSSVAGKGPNLIRALLPKFVEAEAERLGCGPIRLTLPEALE